MPFYRITIWVKDRPKPMVGIREIDDYNIDVVYYGMEKEIYGKIKPENLVDYEVAMLPKACTAVKAHLNKIYKTKVGLKIVN